MDNAQNIDNQEQSLEDAVAEQLKSEKEKADAEYLERLKTFKTDLQTLDIKSQDLFERQLSFISAGALALSVTFISSIVKNIESANWKAVIVFGWAMEIVTLAINCYSHMKASRAHQKTIDDINDNGINYDYKAHDKRNKGIKCWNNVSYFTMIIGLALITIFIIKNTLYMPKENNAKKLEEIRPYEPDMKKGFSSYDAPKPKIVDPKPQSPNDTTKPKNQ